MYVHFVAGAFLSSDNGKPNEHDFCICIIAEIHLSYAFSLLAFYGKLWNSIFYLYISLCTSVVAFVFFMLIENKHVLCSFFRDKMVNFVCQN